MLDRLHRVISGVGKTDRDLAMRSARMPRTTADVALRVLGNAANHSMLWLTAAAVLGLRSGSTRRAAIRGIAAIACASAVTNLLGKPLLPRRRPPAELVASHRRLTEPPMSSSFPSGHAASAAAFATAVTMESPVTGAIIAPIAAAVAYSRVHTGVHWPSDVVCGAALGAGMAWATRRWWPVRPAEQAAYASPAQLPALPDGAGLAVLVNPEAGDGTLVPEKWITQHWPAAKVVYPASTGDLATEIDRLATANSVRALGVAGGDGTVATVAAVAARHRIPLAVLPTGTLNHFATDLGIPGATPVIDAVRHGRGCTVDLGTARVDGHPIRWFLNTASLGGYPDMVRFREKWAPRWGKWPAAAAASVRVLYDSTPLDLEIAGVRHRVWVLFIGNGAYAPRGFAPTWRPNLDNGLLDVRYVRADTRFSRLRFVLAAMAGALKHSRTYVERSCPELEVVVHGRPVTVATDGEIGLTGNKFTFAAHQDALQVYRPSTTD
ncbi:phosphatase PAP2 family protein [Saccharopolyspora sp. K220]|uniref:bifunctional phosphatase PAP2/diacylglycerol kinase family protein n=1 Tax=Saccharopolyspora soli TaxID=2926618 RepID=UPI001F568857|nr:bifunctional phosphatase PAP2/diacylglycerol kinase family protein [Saccharopolyspora soli]MCI2418455.1 phosphatase PAP2 family protein [Saccharopolyspora soli]